MDNRSIVMIKRENLQPHPDNPRKDLGDLTELRESIRENGIMQNLTVVPCGDGLVDSGDYMILIGHRRFAASEGILDELPCVIANKLSKKEQVGIMLEENMQRADLTYLEQAHGFQMMLDLGDTVESISKKTGFSAKTIKHRLAICELDPEAIEEASNYFEPTISDYIALEKVKDIDKRNEILFDANNSRDIQDAVKDYLEDVQEKENFEYYRKIFEDAGWIHEDKNQWFYYQEGFKHVDGALGRLDLTEEHPLIPEDKLKKLMDQIKGEVHFGMCYHALMVRTYKAPKVTGKSIEEKEKERKAAEALKKKNRKALREIRAQICDAVMDFILESKVELNDPQKELGFFYTFLDLCRDSEVCVTLYSLTTEKVRYKLDDKLSLKGYNKVETGHFDDFENWTPLFQLLANIWWSLASSYSNFEDYGCHPKKDLLDAYKTFLDLLHDLDGFRIEDEWKPVLDGTSELYEKKGGK